MKYLTFEEYVGIGGTLNETAFNRLITRVCGIVTNATQGRIETLYGIPTEVKEVCRDLVEFLEECEGTQKVQSRSQSAGGLSESVTYLSDVEATEHINGILFDYLYSLKTKNGVSVLYKGCAE